MPYTCLRLTAARAHLQIGILPYAGVDIMLFELLKERLIEHHHGDVPAPCILGAGMASSLCAQVISYPLTVVRTRLQAQGTADRPERYSGMTNVFVKTIRTEGYRGLYKVRHVLGLSPSLPGTLPDVLPSLCKPPTWGHVRPGAMCGKACHRSAASMARALGQRAVMPLGPACWLLQLCCLASTLPPLRAGAQ